MAKTGMNVIVRGSIPFQANMSNLSYRRRGYVARSHIQKYIFIRAIISTGQLSKDF